MIGSFRSVVPGGLGYRPGLDQATVDLLMTWAAQRIARFLDLGREPDGWGLGEDGVWRLWARLTPMPLLDSRVP